MYKRKIDFLIFNQFSCQKAHHILKTDTDIKQRWSQAVRWLHEQLEVRKTFKCLFGKLFFFSLAIL
jgi:hypothetical protein